MKLKDLHFGNQIMINKIHFPTGRKPATMLGCSEFKSLQVAACAGMQKPLHCNLAPVLLLLAYLPGGVSIAKGENMTKIQKRAVVIMKARLFPCSGDSITDEAFFKQFVSTHSFQSLCLNLAVKDLGAAFKKAANEAGKKFMVAWNGKKNL